MDASKELAWPPLRRVGLVRDAGRGERVEDGDERIGGGGGVGGERVEGGGGDVNGCGGGGGDKAEEKTSTFLCIKSTI